jgi:hypothetical protein
MAKEPKLQDGEGTPEELMVIDKEFNQDAPTKEEDEDLTKEFGDGGESAA